jgi:hypothetical protein
MRPLLVVCLMSMTAFAQEPSFEALGQITVVGGDRVKARERALDEALRQAVEQAVATILDPPAVVARSAELRLRIYPKARSYVSNYRILDEGETSGVFQVHVSAQVATGNLARDLATTQPPPTANGQKARAVVCANSPAIERVAKAALAARGVELAPPPPTCSEDVAARAAQAAGAQGALVGSSETTAEGPIRGTAQVAARAKVKLALVESSGRVSAQGASDRTAYAPTAAGAAEAAEREAATEATRELQPSLAARWPSGDVVAGGVTVHVRGALRWSEYASLLRALSALPGVAAVEPRRFSKKEADLLLRTASSAPQIASALDHAPPAGVRVTAAAEGDAVRIDVAATPAPDGG